MVYGDGLQDSRRPQQTAHGRRQRRPPDAGVEQRRHPGHFPQNVGVAHQRGHVHAVGQEGGHADVDDQAHRNGQHRSQGDGALGILQIARHLHSGSEPGYRREEDAEEHHQRHPVRQALQRWSGWRCGRHPQEDRGQGQSDGRHDEVLSLDGQRGADQHDGGHREGGPGPVEPDRRLAGLDADGGQKALHKADDVETDAEGEPHEQGNAQSTPDGQPQTARDDVVDAAGPHPLVGGDGGDAQPGSHRDHVSHDDDADGHPQAGLPHDPRQAQVHDHAQDRQDRRREHAAEGAELACLRHASHLTCSNRTHLIVDGTRRLPRLGARGAAAIRTGRPGELQLLGGPLCCLLRGGVVACWVAWGHPAKCLPRGGSCRGPGWLRQRPGAAGRRAWVPEGSGQPAGSHAATIRRAVCATASCQDALPTVKSPMHLIRAAVEPDPGRVHS